MDIEDPNMLDKIEEKSDNLMSLTPLQKNICNFCNSNSKENEIFKVKERKASGNYNNSNVFFNKYVLDIHSQKKHYEGIFFVYLLKF